MVTDVADQLAQIVDTAAERLRTLDEQHVRAKPAPETWSIQEILGHLVDSAANNHQRFVRAQASSELVFPGYGQDHWVRVQGYNEISWPDLVELWRLYNHLLVQVIARIPEEELNVACRIGPDEPVSLRYLVGDYVAHLQHHLEQIEAR